MPVKMIDDWMIKTNPHKGNTTNLYHMCKGNPEKVEFMEKSFKNLTKKVGMWPIKDGKCIACEAEIPSYVMVHIP
jgi:hypothetical protein